jgi:hypothetical protein
MSHEATRSRAAARVSENVVNGVLKFADEVPNTS